MRLALALLLAASVPARAAQLRGAPVRLGPLRSPAAGAAVRGAPIRVSVIPALAPAGLTVARPAAAAARPAAAALQALPAAAVPVSAAAADGAPARAQAAASPASGRQLAPTGATAPWPTPARAAAGARARHPLVQRAALWAGTLTGREPAEFSSPEAYIARLDRLLELEREAERAEERRLASASLALRERLGTSVGDLEVAAEERLPGGAPVYTLRRRGSAGSPFHALGRGDLVTVSDGRGRPVDGTVDGVRGDRVSVALPPGARLAGGGLRLDLASSDVTYRRMKAALEELRLSRRSDTLRLRDAILGLRPARVGRSPERLQWRNHRLDEFQKEAVRKALAAPDVGVIHGPPGTGKTTTLVELIYQSARRKESVLATAPSNVAVDNLLEKLAETGLRVVRLGNPARVPEHLRRWTLEARMEDSEAGRALKALKLRLAATDPREDEHFRLKRQVRVYEEKLREKVLAEAQVVLATHGGLDGPVRAEPFDLAVLDEASQAVEPLSWIPLLQAKRAVFAGDPRQLAPTISSPEAKRGGLGHTMMERLLGALPDALKSLLRMQYRMHEAIMDFPSREFYGGALIAHPSVAAHTAKDLPGVKDTPLTRVPERVIDAGGGGAREAFDELTQSYYNEGEAELVRAVYRDLRAAGLGAEQIGIITPYSAQKHRLRELLGADGPEIHTVDGFQGREKEVLIVSMVRGNPNGELGFLEELERLNVALTRPRRLRVVIGSAATLRRQPVFRRFLESAERRGALRSAADWRN